MREDPEGLAILTKLNIERFITIEDSLYDSVRQMNIWVTEHQ